MALPVEERSKLGFVNAALKELGEDAIPSIEEADDTQASALTIYDTVSDELLYGYPWSWSLEAGRERLLQTTVENSGWEYAFQVPQGFIGNIRAIRDSASRFAEPRLDWTRRGSTILTDFNPAFAELQRYVAPAGWPALYVAALIPLLISRMAVLVVEDPDMGRHYERIHENALKKALRADGQAKPAQQIQRFGYIEARLGGLAGPFRHQGRV